MERLKFKNTIKLVTVCSLVALELIGLADSCKRMNDNLEIQKQANKTCLSNGGRMKTDAYIVGMFSSFPSTADVSRCIPKPTAIPIKAR